MQHPIDSMMQKTMESIRSMVDVNTVVGSPVTGRAGTTIIPISKVSFGFVAGGGEYAVSDGRVRVVPEETMPFAGGTGAGVTIQPMGFLVSNHESVRLLPAQPYAPADRIIELAPQIMCEIKKLLKEKNERSRRISCPAPQNTSE